MIKTKPVLPFLVGLFGTVAALGHGLEITVNSSGNDNTRDNRLTFVEAVLIANERLGRTLSAGESALVVTNDAGHDLTIRFAIAGAGPHFISAPPGGFPPLMTDHFEKAWVDGFSQLGAQPNTAALSGTNNAVLKIVLDCRVLSPDAATGETPDWSFKIAAPNVHFRGFSVLAGQESSNYGVYFTDGAVGGQVSGCWFGVSPDQTILAGGEVAIAAYGSAGGQVFGSNGDGVDDLAEINVIVAHAIGVQFEDTKDILVQHNLIGVMPDGKTLPPAEIRDALEGDAVEGSGLTGTITLRRNVMGGMRGDVVQFYGPAEKLVLLENSIGVTGDGITPLPNGNFLRVEAVQAVVGPDAGAMPESGSENRIANHSGYLFRYARSETRIRHGANLFANNTGPYFEQLEKSLTGARLGRDTDLAPLLTPGTSSRQILRGTIPLSGPGTNSLTTAIIDLYRAEPGPDAEHPEIGRQLASFTEGSTADLDPLPGVFAFDLSAVAGMDTAAHLAVTSTLKDATGIDTSPFSNLIELPAAAPRLAIVRENSHVVLTWSDGNYRAQILMVNLADPKGWLDLPGSSPIRVPTSDSSSAFFRLQR
jgi:hypothetical protein